MKIELNENTQLLFLCIAIGVSLIILILSALVVYLLLRNKRNVTGDELRGSLMHEREIYMMALETVENSLNSEITQRIKGDNEFSGEMVEIYGSLGLFRKQLIKNGNQIFVLEGITANHSKYIRAIEDKMELLRKNKELIQIINRNDEKRKEQMAEILEIQEQLIEKYANLKVVPNAPEEVKQVEPKDETFDLPECWHVVVTEENQRRVSEWRYGGEYSLVDIGKITGMCKWNNGVIDKQNNPSGAVTGKDPYGFSFGKEITTVQFDKYVLKLNVDEPKQPKEPKPLPIRGKGGRFEKGKAV
jgi:hypothetical protein